MRTREEIVRDFIQIPKVLNLLATDKNKTGLLMNPKLQLEVLLDIRDLLVKLTEKK